MKTYGNIPYGQLKDVYKVERQDRRLFDYIASTGLFDKSVIDKPFHTWNKEDIIKHFEETVVKHRLILENL